MQEYWVNVYDFSGVSHIDGAPIRQFGKIFDCNTAAMIDYVDWGFQRQIPIYRIHVKMKPVARLSQIPKYEFRDI